MYTKPRWRNDKGRLPRNGPRRPTNPFNGECDAMVDMTLNDLNAKVKVIYFDTSRFLILLACLW